MKSPFKYSFLLLLFLIDSQNCFSQFHSSNYFVHLKGTVKLIQAFMGGAAPNQEILEKMSKPAPMENAQLFLKKTYYGNISFIIQTDSFGNFDLNIKPGLYNIYLTNENSSSKKIIDSTDVKSTCEEEYKIQSHGTLKIYKKGNSPVEITISETINPCGPLPPGALQKQN
ncbi:MAG: hypothetical protein ABIT08_13740 [Bacteroidia bacterium]